MSLSIQQGQASPYFKSIRPDQKVVIKAISAFGRGDIALGIKIANDLIDRGGIQAEQIYLCSNRPISEYRNMIGAARFHVIEGVHPRSSEPYFNPAYELPEEREARKPYMKELYEDAEFVNSIALEIVLPDHIALSHWGNKTGIPCVLVSEYNHNSPVTFNPPFEHVIPLRLGIQGGANPALRAPFLSYQEAGLPNPIGWRVSHELREWAKSDGAGDYTEKDAFIDELTEGFREKLRGSHSLGSLGSDYKVYMAYLNQAKSKDVYLLAVLKLHQQRGQGNDITVVLPGNSNLDLSALKTYASGIQVDDNELVDGSNAGGPKLRIITGQVDHRDMMLLEKISEKETARTGDQSWSEAVSANKIWTYETLDHKEGFRSSLDASVRGVPGTPPLCFSDKGNPSYTSDLMQRAFQAADANLFTRLNDAFCEQDYFDSFAREARAFIEARAATGQEGKPIDLRKEDTLDQITVDALNEGKKFLLNLDQMRRMQIDMAGKVTSSEFSFLKAVTLDVLEIGMEFQISKSKHPSL